ncbi:MAG: fumarate hydratase subunit alpha [Erysipelotrichaceae bacterium]|nr:MAG: fumarate hydratase subunit [Erysipelotrichaceae bacterium]TXT17980.1 MAG: fumarate hydratase subunit alpha [Erysipelotrichaceae bacterium]
MRTIHVNLITETVKELCLKANFDIGDSMLKVLEERLGDESSPLGKTVLKQMINNDKLAKLEGIAICQDTGMTVVFIEVGQEVSLVGGDFNDAIHQGVRLAYKDGFLRKSVVDDPLFDRINTKDNTPAVIHTTITKGDQIKIEVMPKGFGSENMSTLKMFPPSAGLSGVKKFILDTVEKAGPNACPPIIVGVGIGGTFEQAALISKRALLRGVGQSNPHPKYAQLEIELIQDINRLGIGPAGLGGSTTAISVNIEHYPTHIASIPVAINICCHVSRHASAII